MPTRQVRSDLEVEKKCRFATIPAHVATMAIQSASAAARWARCAAAQRWRYQKRISGPLMDRFDIYIEVPRVDGLFEPQTS
jgi:predicted ATPase with chaperone activity